jgi:hypothetical protein
LGRFAVALTVEPEFEGKSRLYCLFEWLFSRIAMFDFRNCSNYQSKMLRFNASSELQFGYCTLHVSRQCCEYGCIVWNSIQNNVSHCNNFLAPAYFSCRNSSTLQNISPPEPDDSNMFKVFESYQSLGRACSGISIACCAIIFLISLYCKFYSQWADQIILSKTLFVFGFGVCLLTSFRTDGECKIETSVATIALNFGDILWTSVLVFKLVRDVYRPFQQASILTGILINWSVSPSKQILNRLKLMLSTGYL